jgi:peptide/nickel transport system permease protein
MGYIFLQLSSFRVVYFETFGEKLWISMWSYYIIPGMILGISDGVLSEMIRHCTAELNLLKNEAYVRMARAKGASIWKHVKNHIIIHTSRIASSRIVVLISGAVIIEYIFGLPGIGSLAFDAAEARDTNLLLGIAIFSVLVVSLLNFLNKLTAIALDPRLRRS